jgi:hypothetical protein
MVLSGDLLPEFMSDDGSYAKIPISADNMLFMYIVGIKNVKKMTPENQKSLIKIDDEALPREVT